MHDSSLILNLLIKADYDKSLENIAKKHLNRIVSNAAEWTEIDRNYLSLSVHKHLTQERQLSLEKLLKLIDYCKLIDLV